MSFFRDRNAKNFKPKTNFFNRKPLISNTSSSALLTNGSDNEHEGDDGTALLQFRTLISRTPSKESTKNSANVGTIKSEELDYDNVSLDNLSAENTAENSSKASPDSANSKTSVFTRHLGSSKTTVDNTNSSISNGLTKEGDAHYGTEELNRTVEDTSEDSYQGSFKDNTNDSEHENAVFPRTSTPTQPNPTTFGAGLFKGSKALTHFSNNAAKEGRVKGYSTNDMHDDNGEQNVGRLGVKNSNTANDEFLGIEPLLLALKNFQKKHNTQEEQIHNLTDELKRRTDQLAITERKICVLSNGFQKAQATVRTFKELLENLKEEKLTLAKKVEICTNGMCDLNFVSKDAKTQILTVTEKLNEAQRQICDTKNEYEKKSIEVKSLTEQVDRLSGQLSEEKLKTSLTEQNFEVFRSKYDTIVKKEVLESKTLLKNLPELFKSGQQLITKDLKAYLASDVTEELKATSMAQNTFFEKKVETVIDEQRSLISKHSEEMVRSIFNMISPIEEKVQQMVKESSQLQSKELVNLREIIEKRVTGISDNIKTSLSSFSQDVVLKKIESTNSLLKEYNTKKTGLESQIEELIVRNTRIELEKTGYWEKIENLQLQLNEKEFERIANESEITNKFVTQKKHSALVIARNEELEAKLKNILKEKEQNEVAFQDYTKESKAAFENLNQELLKIRENTSEISSIEKKLEMNDKLSNLELASIKDYNQNHINIITSELQSVKEAQEELSIKIFDQFAKQANEFKTMQQNDRNGKDTLKDVYLRGIELVNDNNDKLHTQIVALEKKLTELHYEKMLQTETSSEGNSNEEKTTPTPDMPEQLSKKVFSAEKKEDEFPHHSTFDFADDSLNQIAKPLHRPTKLYRSIAGAIDASKNAKKSKTDSENESLKKRDVTKRSHSKSNMIGENEMAKEEDTASKEPRPATSRRYRKRKKN